MSQASVTEKTARQPRIRSKLEFLGAVILLRHCSNFSEAWTRKCGLPIKTLV